MTFPGNTSCISQSHKTRHDVRTPRRTTLHDILLDILHDILHDILLRQPPKIQGRRDSRSFAVQDPVAREPPLARAVVRPDGVDADGILVAVVHVESALVHVLALLVRPGVHGGRGFVPVERTRHGFVAGDAVVRT